MLFNGFPYTNFHEMNLDYILQSMRELDSEMKNYVRTVSGNSAGIITVVDGNGGTAEIGLIRDSLNANQATNANNDRTGRDIRKYILGASIAGNVITLTNALDEDINLTVTTTTNTIVTLTPNEYTPSGDIDFSTVNVGDSLYFDSDKSIPNIGTAFRNDNFIMMKYLPAGVVPQFAAPIVSGPDEIYITIPQNDYALQTTKLYTFKIQTDNDHTFDSGYHLKLTRVI